MGPRWALDPTSVAVRRRKGLGDTGGHCDADGPGGRQPGAAEGAEDGGLAAVSFRTSAAPARAAPWGSRPAGLGRGPFHVRHPVGGSFIAATGR